MWLNIRCETRHSCVDSCKVFALVVMSQSTVPQQAIQYTNFYFVMQTIQVSAPSWTRVCALVINRIAALMIQVVSRMRSAVMTVVGRTV